MSKLKRTLSSQGGFTLVELLTALALSSLLTMLVVLGVNLASKQQRVSLYLSQASTVASTVNNALADSLRYATYKTDDSGNVTYTIYYRDDPNVYIVGSADNIGLAVGDGSSVTSYDADGNVWEQFTLEQGELYLVGPSPSGKGNVYFKVTNVGTYGAAANVTSGGNASAVCEVTKANMELGANGNNDLVAVSFTINPVTAMSGGTKDVNLTYRINGYTSSEKDTGTVYSTEPEAGYE